MRRGWVGAGLALHALACEGSTPVRTAVAVSGDRSLLFQAACASCHARADTGAPLVGVEDDWRERRAQGFEALFAHTVDGTPLMPPLGTCGLCSREDLRALVAYVSGVAEPAP